MGNENQTNDLRVKISELQKVGGRRKYTPEISEQIVQYTREQLARGKKKIEIAMELGTNTSTLYRMLGGKASRESDDSRFKQVRVGDLVGAERKICLPGGVSIVGLSLNELIVVAQGLRK